MRRSTQGCRRGTITAAVTVAALAVATAAGAVKAGSVASYDIGSLASPFLQSKTQMTILGKDDQAAPGCRDKHFVKASPADSPAVHAVGAITERKWHELWTLDRCGSQINYVVWFTEVGNGGAYYAIVGPDMIAGQ